MRVSPDVKRRARALKSEPLYEQAAEYLMSRANKDLLNATTPEDREDKWRDYHALKGVVGLIARWAAESKTQD